MSLLSLYTLLLSEMSNLFLYDDGQGHVVDEESTLCNPFVLASNICVAYLAEITLILLPHTFPSERIQNSDETSGDQAQFLNIYPPSWTDIVVKDAYTYDHFSGCLIPHPPGSHTHYRNMVCTCFRRLADDAIQLRAEFDSLTVSHQPSDPCVIPAYHHLPPADFTAIRPTSTKDNFDLGD
ncbi:hypothetical protein BX666DRAFT_129812 [Dichotomocladium elegans]|nr:hypothetical protein BX666DRAFT_129812 [Dichotomocladium elegans]